MLLLKLLLLVGLSCVLRDRRYKFLILVINVLQVLRSVELNLLLLLGLIAFPDIIEVLDLDLVFSRELFLFVELFDSLAHAVRVALTCIKFGRR